MWEKVLFLRGTLRFQNEPDERVSVGFCSFWSMMKLNSCIFWQSEQKTIFGNSNTEYAPDRENAAEILIGDNGFCSKSWVQNVENLNFLRAFESFHFQLKHISKWAKSERNLLIWFNLKSELGFIFFIFFEDEKNSGRYAHGFGRHMQNVGKLFKFFSCHNALPKPPKTHFLSFLGKNKPNRK